MTTPTTPKKPRSLSFRTVAQLVALAIADAAISLWVGRQAYLWMPPQASAEAVLVDDLFGFLTTIGSFIFLGVTTALLYSVLFQRADKYDISDGPPVEGNLLVEILWTTIPLGLVIWIATYSYQIYDQMAILGPMEHMNHVPQLGLMPPAEAATLPAVPERTPIEVHVRQWAWEFRYPDQNIVSTELHLPVNERARLKLISEDVLHGFYVPAFRVKQDVIPGSTIDFGFMPIREGRYRLRDSDYSGTYFAANQGVVVVESEEAYQQWLADAAAQPLTEADNRAFREFTKLGDRPISAGWKTVEPAPPPRVNFASSEEDSYE
ncbi:cytochrome c oxidase subunit II [Nodosilinea sp. FACHB-13]|uniref:cytochrome c oxidase subunit II n=1 Tax=Cyanophyceae TaxID=3028117 RepID=UPI00168321E8|nr:cytochrome c oxidase subunit II [Nodosilinea sp. FACHB-13]MBD2110111.1 cytochrome c oxidase subunit II [Nodosilinea sp. FACHB-13]